MNVHCWLYVSWLCLVSVSEKDSLQHALFVESVHNGVKSWKNKCMTECWSKSWWELFCMKCAHTCTISTVPSWTKSKHRTINTPQDKTSYLDYLLCTQALYTFIYTLYNHYIYETYTYISIHINIYTYIYMCICVYSVIYIIYIIYTTGKNINRSSVALKLPLSSC